ncbi:MAG: PAS domain S-box protein, partial [Desulfovibrio sp.]
YTAKEIKDLAGWFPRAYPDSAYREQVLGDWQEALTSDEKEAVREFQVTCKDGTVRDVEFRAVFLPNQQALVTLSDSTARKQSESALKESETRYRELFENASDGIALFDDKHHILDVNPQFIRSMGYTREEMLGRSILEFIDPENLAATPSQMPRLLSGETVLIERKFMTKQGGLLPLEVKLRQISPNLIQGMYRDVTERLRMAEAMIAAKEAAETANKAKSEFLATMSHEIRTPLNGILGMLQLTLGTALNQEQQQFVETATLSARSLQRILSDILDLSRIESGAVNISLEEFRLSDSIGPVIDAFREESTRKNVKLAWAMDPAMPEGLVGDPVRIRQILYNLVGNAVKYTEGGTVRLEAYPLPVVPAADGVNIHFSVSDTGIGIPDDKMKHVFETFSQADGSYTRKYGGAGLGLSIVKRLVKIMGGSLAVASELGKGTEIHVTLPLGLGASVAEAQRAYTAPGVIQPPQVKAKVLLVEDEAVNRMAVQRMLERMGHTVACSRNGEEAVQAVGEGTYDVVIMDVQMPVMDGVEATKAIRAMDTSRSKVPIIALTAHAMAGDKEIFLQAGMNDYLSKPVDVGELERAVQQALA